MRHKIKRTDNTKTTIHELVFNPNNVSHEYESLFSKPQAD